MGCKTTTLNGMHVVGPVSLTAIAHGGEAVGRLDGRVIFARGGLPGEDVMVRLTDTSKTSFWRGRVAEVITASPERISPPCPIAGDCGGCDFQHAAPSTQRELKRQVVAEQLQRLAGLDWQGHVQSVGQDLGWRTRMRYHRGEEGLGLRAAGSRDGVPLPKGGCLIAHPKGRAQAQGAKGESVSVTVASSGVAVNDHPSVVSERVHDRSFNVAASGFWQVHPRAAQTLVDAVLAGLGVVEGEMALDLYSGVGLFAGFLFDQGAKVVGIEGNRIAVGHARKNVPQASFHVGDVAKVLHRLKPKADIVVLDPPRSGAGQKVVDSIVSMGPRKVAYVSCDPATLARDLATFQRRGYRLIDLHAFDLFPMTHHVECVAFLVP